jgi:hypothetical protein
MQIGKTAQDYYAQRDGIKQEAPTGDSQAEREQTGEGGV